MILSQYFTVLFESSFETGDFSEWTGTGGIGNAPTVVTTNPFRGTYHAQVSTPGSVEDESSYFYKNLGSNEKTIYVREYLKYKDLPDAVNRYNSLINLYDMEDYAYRDLCRAIHDGTDVHWEIYDTSTSDRSTETVSVDTWYCLELGRYYAASGGWLRLWVDGSLVCELTGLTQNESCGRIVCGFPGSSYAGAFASEAYVDDVIAADSGPIGVLPWVDDFEENDNFAARGWTVNGTPVYGSSMVYYGDYVLECDANNDFIERGFPDHSTHFSRFYWRHTVNPSTGNANGFFVLRANGSAVAYITVRNPAGTVAMQLYQYRGNVGYKTIMNNPAINTWYCVELKFVKHASSGEYTVWINGTQEWSDTGLDTSGADPDEVVIGQFSTYTVTTYIDSLIVSTSRIGELELVNGFEGGDFSWWTGTSGSPTVQSTTKHHGTYACQFNAYEYIYRDFTDRSEVNFRWYGRWEALPDSGNTRIALLRGGNGGTQLMEVEYELQGAGPNHQFKLENVKNMGVIGTYQVELTTGQWYCIEVHYKADTDGTDGEAHLYLDGTLRISSTTQDFDTVQADRFFLISDSFTSVEIYVDCVVISEYAIGQEVVGGVPYEKELTELFGFLDSYSRVWTAQRTHTELFGFVDGIEKQPAITRTELFGMVDSIIKSSSLTRSEILGLVDTTVKGSSVVKSENLGLVDSYERVWTIQRIHSEILGLLDVYDRTWTLERAYTELLGLLDDLTAIKAFFKELTELLGMVDSIKRDSSIYKTESLGLVDSYSRTWTLARTYSELFGFLDAIQKGPSITRTELLGLLDALESLKVFIKALTETLGLVDTIKRDSAKMFSELLGLSDSISKHPAKTFTELLGLLDTIEKVLPGVFLGARHLLEQFERLSSMVQEERLSSLEQQERESSMEQVE